jgi:hypothetical protein
MPQEVNSLFRFAEKRLKQLKSDNYRHTFQEKPEDPHIAQLSYFPTNMGVPNMVVPADCLQVPAVCIFTTCSYFRCQPLGIARCQPFVGATFGNGGCGKNVEILDRLGQLQKHSGEKG